MVEVESEDEDEAPKGKAKAKVKAKRKTTTPTRKKPLRVYSETEEGESENSDSKAEQSKNDEAEEVDEDFPSLHLAFFKTVSSTKKAAARHRPSNPTRNRKASASNQPLPGTESDAPPPKKREKHEGEK